MNLSSTDLAKRRSAGFISVKDMEGNDIYVNLDMIVNVVKKNQYCILNMYGGELSPIGNFFCKEISIQMSLAEVQERIDNWHAHNFIIVKGVEAIFNTDYSFHFSRDNVATPIGMRISVPGMEIYDQVDLVNLPPLDKPSHHQLADSDKAKGVYWTHVNLILGIVSEGNSNYWHICLLGGKSVRMRGPLRTIFEAHPNLTNIPLVNVKDGILLNLNHLRFFYSGKNILRMNEKVTIENSSPLYAKDEFTIEKSDYKKVIKEFLHTGKQPEVCFRKQK